jgi:hypothetical protein
MTRSARVTINAAKVSPSKTIATMADSAPLAIVTGRLLTELVGELGGSERAHEFLIQTVERIGHPIAIHVEISPTKSRTLFFGPRSWSSERLQGWAAVYHEALAAEFGECVRVGKL